MSLKESAIADNHRVFLNADEFADIRTIMYNGKTYRNIKVALSGAKESARAQRANDHAEGFYRVTRTLHCAISDLGGNQPEKGQRIRINDKKGRGGFVHEYFVASSTCAMGMLRVELEAIDE